MSINKYLKKRAHRAYIWLLRHEAVLVRNRTPAKIIAITGGIGKTSTRDAVHKVLSSFGDARRNTKNFNLILGVSRVVLGVPAAWALRNKAKNVWNGLLAIFRLSTHPKYIVLEVGMTKEGDMSQFLWLKPDVIVYTRFPDVPSHVEFFASPEAVVKEKLRLKEELSSVGLLVLNADDPRMDDILVTKDQRRITFGVKNAADVTASDVTIEYKDEMPYGISATITYNDQTENIVFKGTLGTHHIYPLLAAFAVGVGDGFSLSEVVSAVKDHVGPRARMRLLEGVNNSLLIDDSYNASPTSMSAGITTVQDLKVKGRKIFALADMLELGEFSHKAHVGIGELVVKKCDVFVAVGKRMSEAAALVQKHNPDCEVITCSDADEAVKCLLSIVKKDDVVYVKGSGGMRMGAVAKGLVTEDDMSSTILMSH